MNIPDINDVPLSKKEVMARCRSLAATALIFLVTLRFFSKTGGYKNVFQYHPIMMMIAFVMVLPDVATSFKRLKGDHSKTAAGDAATKRPSSMSSTGGLPHGEIVLRHQLSAFAMEVAAGCGFAAVEYTKITNGYAHLASPHAMVGAACGAAIVCQMVLGTLLRYVLTRRHPMYKTVLNAHKLTSLTIIVTGLMGIAGGFLSTSFAEMMIPSSAVRTVIVMASVSIAVAGLLF